MDPYRAFKFQLEFIIILGLTFLCLIFGHFDSFGGPFFLFFIFIFLMNKKKKNFIKKQNNGKLPLNQIERKPKWLYNKASNPTTRVAKMIYIIIHNPATKAAKKVGTILKKKKCGYCRINMRVLRNSMNLFSFQCQL